MTLEAPNSVSAVVIYGAGGHAKVVADAARASGLAIGGFLEDGSARDGAPFFGSAIISWERFQAEGERWAPFGIVPAIGDNAARAACCERLRNLGRQLITVVHPSAVVSPNATLGPGSVILPRAIINAGACVGTGVIINSGAVVEHDCQIGDFAHLSPNVTLGGGVKVGERTHVGLGAVVLPRVTIGSDARVGAGAVVLSSVEAGATVVGIPAHSLRLAEYRIPARQDSVPVPPPRISFVIPIFRNRGTIQATYSQVVAVVKESFPTFDYQFVLVDDGSDDGSHEEILGIRAEDQRVDVISFSRNFGQVAAMIAGLRSAKGNATVILSADLQDPATLIADMVREWQLGSEVVVCHRSSREDAGLAGLSSRIFYGLIRLESPRMPVGGFDYVLLGERPREILAGLSDRNRFFQGDVLWLGFRTKFLAYVRRKRPVGKSQWTLHKKVKYFIDGILNTSYLPIRFMSLLGVLVALVGVLYAFVVVYIRLMNEQPYIGYAPVMIAVLITGGVIMTMLGVIGEYLWRIYDEVRGRPLYIIREQRTRSEVPETRGAEQGPTASGGPSRETPS